MDPREFGKFMKCICGDCEENPLNEAVLFFNWIKDFSEDHEECMDDKRPE